MKIIPLNCLILELKYIQLKFWTTIFFIISFEGEEKTDNTKNWKTYEVFVTVGIVSGVLVTN